MPCIKCPIKNKANWADKRLKQPADGDLAGGTVEIFAAPDDLESRRSYVEAIGKAMPMLVQYQFSKGLVLIRLDKAMTPGQAEGYNAALQRLEPR